MSTIKQLSSHLIGQIAAGEAIERPASAVKELVDNSLDAGASSVQVAVLAGDGRSFMVSDDGCGIPADSLEMAFAVHATSKVAGSDDLERVSTMGFRGEALASIAAVSEVRCLSRHVSSEVATQLSFDADGTPCQVPAALARGTSVEVRNLFGKVPARLKFLRKPDTEMAAIFDTVRELAVANPEVSIELLARDRQVFRSSGSGDLWQCVHEVLGKTSGWSYLEDSRQDPSAHLRAMLAPISAARSDTRSLITIVNRRPLQCQLLRRAVRSVFEGFLPRGRYPKAVLALELQPEDIDVNVHPTKREIRYRQGESVYEMVRGAIEKHLIVSASSLSGARNAHSPEAGQLPASDSVPATAESSVADAQRDAEDDEQPRQDFGADNGSQPQSLKKLYPGKLDFSNQSQEGSESFRDREDVSGVHDLLAPGSQEKSLSESKGLRTVPQRLLAVKELVLEQMDPSVAEAKQMRRDYPGATTEFAMSQEGFLLRGQVSGSKAMRETALHGLAEWLRDLRVESNPSDQVRMLAGSDDTSRDRRHNLPMETQRQAWRRDGWRCVYCGRHLLDPELVRRALPHDRESWYLRAGRDGRKVSTHPLKDHQAACDHHLPVAKHGSLADHPDNLVAACRECNQAKGDRFQGDRWQPRSWLPWQGPITVGKLVFESPEAEAAFAELANG